MRSDMTSKTTSGTNCEKENPIINELRTRSAADRSDKTVRYVVLQLRASRCCRRGSAKTSLRRSGDPSTERVIWLRPWTKIMVRTRWQKTCALATHRRGIVQGGASGADRQATLSCARLSVPGDRARHFRGAVRVEQERRFARSVHTCHEQFMHPTRKLQRWSLALKHLLQANNVVPGW